MLNSYMALKASLRSAPRNAKRLNVNFHIRWNHSSTSNDMRKTFKKLYEQTDLVRNTKDQYGVVCDTIWKQSYQRLLVKDGVANLPENLRFPNKHSLFELYLDFFDIKASKNITDSKNQYSVKISSTVPYQQTWLTSSSLINEIPNWVAKLPDRVLKAPNWQAALPNLYVKNFEVKSNRKNIAKLLNRNDASNSKGDRSVVNTALENYSKRVKIKTLNES